MRAARSNPRAHRAQRWMTAACRLRKTRAALRTAIEGGRRTPCALGPSRRVHGLGLWPVFASRWRLPRRPSLSHHECAAVRLAELLRKQVPSLNFELPKGWPRWGLSPTSVCRNIMVAAAAARLIALCSEGLANRVSRRPQHVTRPRQRRIIVVSDSSPSRGASRPPFHVKVRLGQKRDRLIWSQDRVSSQRFDTPS